MSLRISHGCFHGSCGTFNEWRSIVAEAADFPPWWLMEGCWDPADQWLVRRAQPCFNKWKGVVPIPWEPYDSDVLTLLLEHEDDQGILAPEDCGPIADRLEALAPRIRELRAGFRPETIQHLTRRFIDGLRLAASLKQKVTFG
jgi:hypothetical protein